MPPASYDLYPFRPLGERLQQLIDNGASSDRALSHLNTELAAGKLELRAPLPFQKLHALARGRLQIETTDGRLIDATDLEARTRPPAPVPGLLGPTVPMDAATWKRFEVRLRQLGGGYVVSSAGAGYVLPTADEPVPPVQPQSVPEPDPPPAADPPPAPPSTEERTIELLAKRLKRDQAKGTAGTKVFYRALFMQVLDLSGNKFDEVIWVAALKAPGVKPFKAGAPKKKK